MLVYSISISQGSAATRFGCRGIFNDNFIANFPDSVTVEEFWKSVKNCQVKIVRSQKVPFSSVVSFTSEFRRRIGMSTLVYLADTLKCAVFYFTDQ